MSQLIAVLDFGSQYTQVIARRIRECNVYSKIYPYNVKASQLKEEGVKGIILSGGPDSVLKEGSPRPDINVFSLGVPVLGICYGIQLLGHLFGGKVDPSDSREFGYGTLSLKEESQLLEGVSNNSQIWNSHGDKLSKLPDGFKVIATSENSNYAVIENIEKQFYGMQFHPEVSHSTEGLTIIKNYLYNICGCKGDWLMSDYIASSVESIREVVKDKKVVLGLSGGVDSSVAAAIIHKAIGDNLVCIFVDNGLLRKNERQQVEDLFKSHFKMNLQVVDATDRFLDALKGVTDPETKRKIIGNLFVRVFEDAIKGLDDVDFLAQGTLYPDIIESVPIDGNPAALIKSHHNVGGLPEDMKLKLLEPLKSLFKDEVRALGAELGLPDSMLWRHPFPGPGLAVRVMGEITSENLKVLREADAILIEELKREGYYDRLWQGFCVFLPVKTVGVMGDERTYDNVVALRLVESQDAMTADWAQLPHDFLAQVSRRIINEVRGINRVVLDISTKPPSTIEWE